MNDRVYDSIVEHAVADERERCALLCEQLAGFHEQRAIKTRKDGEYFVRALWPFGKLIRCVKPGWEMLAQCQDGAGRSLRLIADCIRKGYDPRKLEPDPNEQIKPVKWMPCARCTSLVDCASWQSCGRGQ
jgi:hypothetical protein